MAMKHVLLTGCISMTAAQAAAIEYRATYVNTPVTFSGDNVVYTSNFGGMLGHRSNPQTFDVEPVKWSKEAGFRLINTPPGDFASAMDQVGPTSYLIPKMGASGQPNFLSIVDETQSQEELIPLPNIPESGFSPIDTYHGERIVGRVQTQFVDYFYEWQRTNGEWSYRRVDGFNGRPLGYSNDGLLYGCLTGSSGELPVAWDANQSRTMFSMPSGFTGAKMAGRLPDGRYLGMLVDNQNRHALGFWTSPTSTPTILYTGALPYFQREQFARESGAFMFGMGSVPYLWTPEDGVRSVASIVQAAIPGTTSFQVYDMDAYGRFAVLSLNTGKMHYIEPVPEPATLTALGLGALALLRRRRQMRQQA